MSGLSCNFIIGSLQEHRPEQNTESLQLMYFEWVFSAGVVLCIKYSLITFETSVTMKKMCIFS